MEWIADPQAWIALVTLTLLEIVLGIDNIIFISILTGKLPVHQQPRARTIGLAFAMITRIMLLYSLVWLTRLTEPLFTLIQMEISIRDLVLIVGGAFLLAKSTMELHSSLEGPQQPTSQAAAAQVFAMVIVQIAIIDIVFSLDSVITAVGMAQDIEVMALAIVIAVFFMMGFAGTVSRFVDTHPTLKVLALSFLLIVGMALIADGLEFHIPRGYIYFAMGFSVFVESLNIRMRRKIEPVHLRTPHLPDGKDREAQ
ncbi:MAG TPA: TerC family protein [Gammaproteobacteria bacterium]|jgi:predicted tellurium resistance membrane protein TerC|nr:TerC family protein [Gammaproteobacteria bacterium]